MNPIFKAVQAWEADIKKAHADAMENGDRNGIPYRELLREVNYIKRRARQGRLEAIDVLRTAREVRQQAEEERDQGRAERLHFIADMLLNLADVVSKAEKAASGDR